jgi:hypothetical protein
MTQPATKGQIVRARLEKEYPKYPSIEELKGYGNESDHYCSGCQSYMHRTPREAARLGFDGCCNLDCLVRRTVRAGY